MAKVIEALDTVANLASKIPGAEPFVKEFKKPLEVLKEIKNRIEKISACHEASKSILKQVDFIESLLNKIEPYVDNLEDDSHMKQFNLHLQNARQICDTVLGQGSKVRKFFKSERNVTELNKVKDNLKEASSQLDLFQGTLNFTENKKGFVAVNKAFARLGTQIENPDAGICCISNKGMEVPTTPVLSYVATADEFILSWKPIDPTVERYELQYDEDPVGTKSIERCTTEYHIGSPYVEPGRIYTMKIRGINSGGQGQWSNSIVAQFAKPVPRQPPAPEVTIVSPTEAEITLKPPKKVCYNESPVTEWLVRYVEDGVGTEWCDIYHTSEPQIKCNTLRLKTLEPDRLYYFKVVAKNAEGWSIPSRVVKKSTKFDLVPSKPTNLRISSKRTYSLIKIRWNSSDSYVTHYEVRCRRKKDEEYDQPIDAKNKLSYTFSDLRHKTRYVFQVQAYNHILNSGWSHEIEGKTRFHKALKVLASPGVFAEATAGSPFFVAMGLGHDAVINQKGTATVVAAGAGGAVAGTLGAPLVGGVMTHLFVHGIDIESDQSDNES